MYIYYETNNKEIRASCTPPFKWPENITNDAFSRRFVNGSGWGSAPGILMVAGHMIL